MVSVVQATFCDIIHHHYPCLMEQHWKSIALSLQYFDVPRTYLGFLLPCQQMSGWLIFPVRIRTCTQGISVKYSLLLVNGFVMEPQCNLLMFLSLLLPVLPKEHP